MTAADASVGQNGPSSGPPPDIEALLEAILPGIRPASVRSLADAGRGRTVRPGELIVRQGEEMPLVLLTRGHAGFRRTTVDGQQLIIGVAYPGGMFGIGSVSATISTVELVALTQAEAVIWRGDVFRRAVAADPALALLCIERLAARLNLLTEKVDGFLHQGARRRVIRILARHRDLFFSDPPVLTRTHLPGLVGTSREMTGRVLRELEREHVVARIGRTGLKLLDPAPLDEEGASHVRVLGVS
ncbi:MAG TPA: Crp/Fnr family transcriptional regulator [Candidatus Limnocylindrales bacterium]|jgi:CRP-like cAMP-binding protein|nr:Crp/Fnr family transcriptional regulator [Candidatus Limnocylindrales bacterium]